MRIVLAVLVTLLLATVPAAAGPAVSLQLGFWETPAAPQPAMLMGTSQDDVPRVSVADAVRLLQERQTGSPPSDAVPEPFQADGVGPGSAQRMGNYICTAAFLFRGGDGTYYVSTAGHCLLKPGVVAATPVNGHTAPDSVHPTISLCFLDCLMNVPALGTYVDFTANPAQGYHPVAFAVANGVGNDFGLIQVPNDALPLLRPWLPQFGGPTGVVDGVAPVGDFLAIYGHGAECCEGVGAAVTKTPVDQGRIGMSLGRSGEGMWYVMTTEGGDSGAPIVTAEVNGDQVVRGLAAQAVNTHGPPGTGFAYGTPISRGIQLAGSADFDLTLVNHDDEIDLGGGTTYHAAVAIASPLDGTSLEPGPLDVSGTVDRLVPTVGGGGGGGGPAPDAAAAPDDWLVPLPVTPYADVEELTVTDEDGVLHVSMYLAGLLDGIVPGVAGNPVSYSVDVVAKHNVASGLTYRLSLQTNLAVPDLAQSDELSLNVLTAVTGALQSVCPVEGALLPGSGIDDDFHVHWYVPLAVFDHDNQPAAQQCASFTRGGRGLEAEDVLSSIIGSADAQLAIVNFGAVDTVTHPDYTIQSGGADPILEHVLVEVLGGAEVLASATASVDTSASPTDTWALEAPLDLSGLAVGDYTLRATWREAGTGNPIASDEVALVLEIDEQVEPCTDEDPETNEMCAPIDNLAPVVEGLLRTDGVDKVVNNLQRILTFTGTVYDSGGCAEVLAGLSATVTRGATTVETLEGSDLSTTECVDGSFDVTFGVTFPVGAAVGTYVVALHAMDDHGAQAADVPTVEVTVRAPPVVTIGYTGGLGHLQFPAAVPGATGVVSANAFTVVHDHEQAEELTFDLEDFSCTSCGIIDTAGHVTLLVDGVEVPYDGAMTSLGIVQPGTTLTVQVRIDEVPAVLPAGNYKSTFGVVAA